MRPLPGKPIVTEPHQEASKARPHPTRTMSNEELLDQINRLVAILLEVMGPEPFAKLKAENAELRQRLGEMDRLYRGGLHELLAAFPRHPDE